MNNMALDIFKAMLVHLQSILEAHKVTGMRHFNSFQEVVRSCLKLSNGEVVSVSVQSVSQSMRESMNQDNTVAMCKDFIQGPSFVQLLLCGLGRDSISFDIQGKCLSVLSTLDQRFSLDAKMFGVCIYGLLTDLIELLSPDTLTDMKFLFGDFHNEVEFLLDRIVPTLS